MSYITLESLESLSQAQCEALADFILSFPASEVVSAKITPEQAFARLAVMDDAPDFMGLLMFASTNVQAKKLTIEEVTVIVHAVGIPSLQLLMNRPDLVPQVHAALVALIASREDDYSAAAAN